jgi:HAD superfamily hydrolase (TIGR01549 family)
MPRRRKGWMLSPDDPSFVNLKAGIRAILFDLDGTLIDTDDAALEALAGRLERFWWAFPGDDPRPLLRRAILAAEGPVNALISLLDMVGLDDNLLSISDRLRRVRGSRDEAMFSAVPGVPEMIRALYPSYRLGVVTTRSRADALAFVRQFGLEALFELAATRDDTERLKPHPEPIRHAVSALGLAPAQCVMVGDTVVDIVSAKSAGSFAVGVLCGFGERDELLEAGADLVLETTSQLQAWF